MINFDYLDGTVEEYATVIEVPRSFPGRDEMFL